MRGAASGGRSGRQPEYQQRPRAGGQSGGVAVAQMALNLEWQSYFWDVMLASRVGVGKPLFLHPVGRDLLHRLQFMFRSSACYTPT